MKLSIGEVKVVEPTLRGWKCILTAIPESVLNALMDAARDAAKAEDDAKALSGVGLKLLTLLRNAPEVLAALAQAVLRFVPDGKAPTDEQAWSLTAADADDVIDAVLQAAWLPDFQRRLKNRLGGNAQAASVPASAPKP